MQYNLQDKSIFTGDWNKVNVSIGVIKKRKEASYSFRLLIDGGGGGGGRRRVRLFNHP